MLDIDPWFFAVAVPAVLITGISKSGFSGGVGVLTVPLMAIFSSPLKAAAIMLPILVLMDLFALWAYRHSWHGRNLVIMLPGAVLGILIGTATFRYVDENAVRLILGVITLGFAVTYFAPKSEPAAPRRGSGLIGALCGIISGFTSFVAHAGGAPIKFFLLPQRMDKTIFVGTNVAFFFAVNQLKLIPYAWLGQFSTPNLTTSLVLAPLAPLGIWLGIRLHHVIPQEFFYRICYGLLFVAGGKLLWDGLGMGGYL